MCTQDVGVVKRIELEKISKEVADLFTQLDEEVKINVPAVKKIQKDLEEVIKEKKS